jgi:AraC-like DNA-binding protein
MFHPHGELVYVIEGSILIHADGQSHTLQAGELGVLFPYVTHSYTDAPEATVLVFLFDPGSTLFDNTLLSKRPARFYTDGRDFYPLLERAVTMYAQGRVKTAIAYLNAVLGELLEVLPLEDATAAGDATTGLLSYCADHYSEPITIKHIAQALFLSQSYVSKIFSQKLGCSFREYINTLRIHKAQTLLQETELQILQVMGECGFQNQSSFNRVFRQHTGLSPREYRAQAKSQ